ncbi:retrovirus-related pol polyprotein from transposon TNT 1-94 [Tanacetum coccineum]
MSTSNIHQQSLADAGSETRPPMLERGSYIPWASRFRRYLNRKRENKKWLNKVIDEGPYKFKNYTPLDSQTPRMQTEEVLKGDDLKHYKAKIKAMNSILISIPNEIYNSVDACTTAKAGKNPLALVAHTGSSSRTPSPYYVTHPSSVVDYDDDYQGDALQTNSEYPFTFAMILLAHTITQRFYNPTNNRLHTSSNTRNQAIVQADKVNIQSRNSDNDGRNTRRSYVQEEIIEGNNVQNDAGNIQRTLRTTSSATVVNFQCYNCSEKGHYSRNCPKPRVQDSKHFMEQMFLAKQDKAEVTLTDEHNHFLVTDATKMEEIKELSMNICLMAKIQPTNIDSDAGPSYDSAFLSKVQTPSTSYVNPLFAKDNQEYVNRSSVEHDNNVQASYALEQLALNAYKEAEKQQINANKNPKLYDASCFSDTKIHVNVRDTEDILDDATKSQTTIENKLKDPVAIEKKQNVRTIDYNKLKAL